MQKLLPALRVALGLCLLLPLGGISVLLLSFAISHQTTSIKERLGCALGFSFFALLGYGIWRILLFRREPPAVSSPLHAMNLFKPSPGTTSDSQGACVPVTAFDVTRRYDIYCSLIGEERLYENVKLTGIRTFHKITEYSSGAFGGFLEIEGADNARILIPQFGIQMICEHGIKPNFKVIRRWTPPG